MVVNPLKTICECMKELVILKALEASEDETGDISQFEDETDDISQ